MTTLDINIKGMSKTEKLQVMEALWDSLIHEDSEIESPEWHQDILAGRQQKIAEGKAEFLTIEELKAKYRQ
ncbi:MAG: addiction module protein [Methylotenera sp.]|nr:addiction module protein [Methyloglobulus sp.]